MSVWYDVCLLNKTTGNGYGSIPLHTATFDRLLTRLQRACLKVGCLVQEANTLVLKATFATVDSGQSIKSFSMLL